MYNFYCYFTNPNKQTEEKPPKSACNNIFNYKEAVNKIYIDEEVSFSLNTDKLEN